MGRDEFATDAEIAQALDEGRKEALAKKAAKEIMGDGRAEEGDPLPLRHGQYPIPDPPTDQMLVSMARANERINAKLATANTHDRDAFDAMIREVFMEEGIVVDVKWYYSAAPGVYIPEVEPYGVTDRHGRGVPGHPDFDPDEQVFDVVEDTLETGQKGVIKSGNLWTPGS